jgi:hypothetical protein
MLLQYGLARITASTLFMDLGWAVTVYTGESPNPGWATSGGFGWCTFWERVACRHVANLVEITLRHDPSRYLVATMSRDDKRPEETSLVWTTFPTLGVSCDDACQLPPSPAKYRLYAHVGRFLPEEGDLRRRELWGASLPCLMPKHQLRLDRRAVGGFAPSAAWSLLWRDV